MTHFKIRASDDRGIDGVNHLTTVHSMAGMHVPKHMQFRLDAFQFLLQMRTSQIQSA